MSQIELNGLSQLMAIWEQAPELVEREIAGFLATATSHLEGEVIERTPAAEGVLRNSIYGEVDMSSGLGVGVITSSSLYATAVELGSKPHMPPVQPLIDWAMTKLGLDDREARRAGFAIARSIAKRGTRPVEMFKRAVDANQLEVQRQFEAMVARLVGRLGGAM